MSDMRLMQGDCLNLMREIPDGSIDAVVTDPPYGLDYTPDARKRIINDRARDFRRLLLRLPDAFALTGARTLAIFTRWDIWREVHDRFERLFPPCGAIVWDKEDLGRGNCNHFGNDHELIYVSAPCDFVMRVAGNRPSALFRCRRTLNTYHPTEKPQALMSYLVEMLCPPNGTVLDPFMGSGTTGVACVDTGRKFIGIELDPAYFAIAERRIAEALNSMPLFEPPRAVQVALPLNA